MALLPNQVVKYHKIPDAEISITKLGFNYYEISTIFNNHRVRVVYNGFSKKEAVKRFKKSAIFSYIEEIKK